MRKSLFILLVFIILLSCNSEPPQPPPTDKLRKVEYESQEQIDQLRKAGAKIIVQEPDYVVIETDSMVSTLSVPSSPIKESDLVQRLIHVYAPDSSDVQKIIDTGIDFWQVKGDTVIARAFDIYIEQLRASGFDVEIIQQNMREKEDQK